MYNRKKYKKYAKIQLKKRWVIPVIASLIYCIVRAIINAPEVYNLVTNTSEFSNETANLASEICDVISICILFIIAFAECNLYIKMSRSPQKITFGDFTEGFSKWLRGILCGLWEGLWTCLWLFLFIIPGFVKHYSYCMTKFVALEYPNLSVFKAMKISIEITRGHKADIFITDLSFIGWFLLGFITCGIGFLWIRPYYLMTMTNVYHALLTEAVETKRIKPEDLTED